MAEREVYPDGEQRRRIMQQGRGKHHALRGLRPRGLLQSLMQLGGGAQDILPARDPHLMNLPKQR